jgi:hypothetical protein
MFTSLTEVIIALSREQAPMYIKKVQIATHNRDGQRVFLNITNIRTPKETPDTVLIEAELQR